MDTSPRPTSTSIRNTLLQSADIMDNQPPPGPGALQGWYQIGQDSCLDAPHMSQHRMVAILTVVVVAVLQIQRLLSALVDPLYGGDHIAREMLIAILGLTGVYLFWIDMKRCMVYEGVLKLVALVGVSNLLLPCLWPTAPKRSGCGNDADEEETEEE